MYSYIEYYFFNKLSLHYLNNKHKKNEIKSISSYKNNLKKIKSNKILTRSTYFKIRFTTTST